MLLEWVHLICEKDFGLLLKLLNTDPFVISLLFFYNKTGFTDYVRLLNSTQPSFVTLLVY